MVAQWSKTPVLKIQVESGRLCPRFESRLENSCSINPAMVAQWSKTPAFKIQVESGRLCPRFESPLG